MGLGSGAVSGDHGADMSEVCGAGPRAGDTGTPTPQARDSRASVMGTAVPFLGLGEAHPHEGRLYSAPLDLNVNHIHRTLPHQHPPGL